MRRYVDTVKFVSNEVIREVIDSREPLGNFITKNGQWWVAVDNTSGEAWTEEFDSLEEAYNFLK